ncbi:probable galacturonosyltransferase-like 1 [Phragmites australis]|uniref:probable galacturonosyltransferase-like 1 n=1 Tax=Phragmites australis TaxID=29695 RepID=UPI002D789D89|nr:probable galacturonosyltransferase-like 1 [Phragmites australis]
MPSPSATRSTVSVELMDTVCTSFLSLAFWVYLFADEDHVAGLISTSIRRALDWPLNYVRSYLASMLSSCVRNTVYLDSYVILTDSIAAMAAPEYCGASFTAYFTLGF